MGASPSTVQRARTFFLNAAETSKLEVGHLLKTSRAPTTPRRRPTKKRAPTGEVETPASRNGAVVGKLPTIVKGLVERLPAEGEPWTEADALEWLDLAKPAFAFSYKFSYEKKQTE
jgi:hypothetical protein